MNVDEFRAGSGHKYASEGRSAGYAEWVALGAVIAGSVGAIVGATRCSHSARSQRFEGDRSASEMLTAPHGDKLAPREW